MASYAAAHGCGPALVRRVIRVGTGWRLQCARTPTWWRGRPEMPDVAGSTPAERTTTPSHTVVTLPL